jgi:uncharacterized protein with beta-barrel porin domain
MMNKAIRTLVLATVDSLIKFKGKLAPCLAVFAMIFGSTSANAVTYNLGDGHGTPVGEITEATQVQSTSLSVAGGVLVIDGDGILDTAVDLTIASITSTTNETTNVVTIEAGGKTITVSGAVISTDADTANYNLTETGAAIDLQGAVSGGATDAIDFSAAANTTLILSGDVAYSANFDGAGTLKVTGTATTDEAIGSAIAMGVLDIDGQLTTTDTIANTVLDLDGTLIGTTLATAGAANLNGTITNSGVVGIGTTTTLGGNSIINTSSDVITFSGAVNGNANLTINSGTAATNFDAAVGGSTGVGAIALTGALDLDAAITDAESISVSLASNLGASITTTGTAATTITLSDAATLSAATTLTTANTNISLEEVNGAQTLTLVAGTGNITTSAAMTQVTTMTVTSATTATFAAVTNATETQLDSSGSNTFSGILTSPIVDINAGTTTFSGVVTASTKIDVAGASTIVNIDAAPNAGELEIAAGTVNISLQDIDVDDLDLNGGSVVVEKTVTNGQTVFISATQTGAGLAGTGKIYLPVNLKNAQTLVLFEDNQGSTVGATTEAQVEAVIADTALTDYVVSEVGNNVVLTSSDKTSSTTATELGVTGNAAKALLQARNSVISDSNVDSTAEDQFFNVLNAKGGLTSADATALAKQVGPAVDAIGGSSVATRAMTGTVQGIVSNRMASLRSGDAFVTGMSAGNGMSANSGFIQAFGSTGEQKNTSNAGATVFGFDAETSGVAIGFDGMTDDGSTVGLSASFSTTDVEGKGTGKSKNSIDSYTVSAYADKATENGYIEGSLTYGINDNSISRKISSAGLTRNYSATYDSNQISLKVGGGVPNEVRDGTFVTPFASATGTMINTDAYTEKSDTANDNLRLKVENDDVTSIVGTVGIKAHMVTDNGTPMISLAVNNEFGDAQISSQNTYTGGGTKFKTTTDVEELSATLGLGYSFGNDVTSLNINYEANANDDEYVNHYGSIKIVSKF